MCHCQVMYQCILLKSCKQTHENVSGRTETILRQLFQPFRSSSHLLEIANMKRLGFLRERNFTNEPVFLRYLVSEPCVDGRLMSSKEIPMEEAPWVDVRTSSCQLRVWNVQTTNATTQTPSLRSKVTNLPRQALSFEMWAVQEPWNFCGKNVSLIFERLKSYRVAWSLLVSIAVSKPTSSYRLVDWAWREKVPKPMVDWAWRENSPFWNRGRMFFQTLKKLMPEGLKGFRLESRVTNQVSAYP